MHDPETADVSEFPPHSTEITDQHFSFTNTETSRIYMQDFNINIPKISNDVTMHNKLLLTSQLTYFMNNKLQFHIVYVANVKPREVIIM